MKRLATLLVGFALLAAACGDDDAASSTTTAAPTTTAATTTVTTAGTDSSSTSSTEAPGTTSPPATAPPQDDLAPGTVTAGVLPFADGIRSYLVAVPPGYRDDTPAPVILDLHGRGQTAVDHAINSGMTEFAWPHGYIVVHPQGIGEIPAWPTRAIDPGVAAEVAFFGLILDTLAADLTIDPDRVFVSGFSLGGGMAGRLACALSDRISGIAVVAASLQGWGVCDPTGPVPVLAIHGVDDQVAPFNGLAPDLPALPDWAAWWAGVNGCGRDPLPSQTVTGRIWHWPVCDDGATVTLMGLNDTGHGWPRVAQVAAVDGEDVPLSSTEVIVDFFNGL